LDNLTLVALFLLLLWLFAMAFYFLTSRRQSDLRDEIKQVRDLLDRDRERRG
jgi:hypothetical protein